MPASHSVLVYGAGAVGGYLGGLLGAAPVDLDVALLGRPAVVEGVRRHGLVLKEAWKETVTHPQVLTDVREADPAELAILCVRAFDVAQSLDDLHTLIGDRGMVLAMQNGVGTEETLARALGRQRVLVGTLTVAVSMEEPGIIRPTGPRGGVALATMDGGPVPPWIADAMTATGLPLKLLPEYRTLRWSKLLLNMLGAPSGAILDVGMDRIAADPHLFRIEQLAFREATRVIDHQHIRTTGLPGYPVSLIRKVMRLPGPAAQRLIGPRMVGARGQRSPAIRADIKRGKTEVRWLNGAVVEAGVQFGVPTPVNSALTALTQELTVNVEARREYAERPDRLVAYVHAHGIQT